MKSRSETSLIFLSFLLRQKPRKTTPNTKDSLPPQNPREPLEKPRKMAENTQNTKEFPLLVKRPRKNKTPIRKSVMSIKFPPVILGPEMAAPILWAPGILGFFLLENPHAHKIPPFRGGSWFFLEGGGWKCQFYFYGRGDFFEPRKIGVFWLNGLSLEVLACSVAW